MERTPTIPRALRSIPIGFGLKGPIAMWELDLNDDTEMLAPSQRQQVLAEQAQGELAALKRTLEKLTVAQQREIIGQLAGTVYRHHVPAGYEDSAPPV
jgi:hypothetical protein